MSKTTYSIDIVGWQDQKTSLREIRTVVFIEEQNVPEELEWDKEDYDCLHVLVQESTGKAIATARLLDNGQIGRMAVLKDYRRQGIGKLMLKTLLEQAIKIGMPSVFLNAQLDAVEFYRPFGFTETGSRFNDAGIQHIRMIKPLPQN